MGSFISASAVSRFGGFNRKQLITWPTDTIPQGQEVQRVPPMAMLFETGTLVRQVDDEKSQPILQNRQVGEGRGEREGKKGTQVVAKPCCKSSCNQTVTKALCLFSVSITFSFPPFIPPSPSLCRWKSTASLPTTSYSYLSFWASHISWYNYSDYPLVCFINNNLKSSASLPPPSYSYLSFWTSITILLLSVGMISLTNKKTIHV